MWKVSTLSSAPPWDLYLVGSKLYPPVAGVAVLVVAPDAVVTLSSLAASVAVFAAARALYPTLTAVIPVAGSGYGALDNGTVELHRIFTPRLARGAE